MPRVPRHHEKREAIKLFEQGLLPPEVAERLKKPKLIRSLQRWFNKWQDDKRLAIGIPAQNVPQATQETTTPNTSQQAIQPVLQTTAQNDLKYTSDLSDIAASIFYQANHAANLFFNALNNESKKSEPSSRSLQILSQCLGRHHNTLIQITGLENFASLDAAYRRLEMAGYVVLDPKSLQEE